MSLRSWLRRCYDWTISWSGHPHAQLALFLISVIEASVFPVPPDVLLITIALGQPALGFRLAAIATIGSCIGAAIGYGIGLLLFATVAQPLLEFYGAMEQFAQVQDLFVTWGLGLVLLAGFSPIPFKVITIAAGAFGLSFPGFMLAALISRAARFYLEGALLRWGGEPLRHFVEKHFELLTMAVALLVLVGVAVLWMWH